jgi:glycine amidinotransferase
MRYMVNEFEPVFDATDFVRCGRDLFVTRSNVTNLSGIAWLRRHLGDGYRIHEIESRCRQPMQASGIKLESMCDLEQIPVIWTRSRHV